MELRQATPSPRSIIEAPEFFLMTPVRSLIDLRMIARRIGEWHVLQRKIKIEALAVFLFVESLRAGIEHRLHIRRNRASFFLQLRDGLFNADGVPNFEGSEFPTESPTHRAIDFDNCVGNLGNAFGCVRQRS